MAIDGRPNTVLMPGLDCSPNGPVWSNFANFRLFFNRQALGYFGQVFRYHLGWKLEEILATLIYRSPMTDSASNQQFTTNLGFVLNHLKPNTKCFIYGDFNYVLPPAENRYRYTSKFIKTMFDHCFYSLINKPTRITSSRPTVLDDV